jgi:ABC-2 type transport system ATP-binding protein
MNPPTATTTTRPRRAAAAPPPVDDDGAVDAVIETRGLTKVYPGGVTAVDGLDLVVRRGEIFGLLGPNGAGKTTTAGMLTTRVIPTSGSALVGGIDVVKRPAEAKRLIGVVPQSNTLDRSLTVWENLFFHGRFFGMDAKTARSESTRLLEQFRLTERSSAPVAALSGGMAQRLMVARAVMHRPSILFLDEPTAGLDPQSRIALWEILGELHVDGQTILLTTHYMEEADQLCDRVAIIDLGRVVALDTPAGLKRSTGADTTVRVTAEGDLEALAQLLRAKVPGATRSLVRDGAVLLGVQQATGVVPAVVAAASRAKFVVTDLSVSDTTLETVFINLTGKDLRE